MNKLNTPANSLLVYFYLFMAIITYIVFFVFLFFFIGGYYILKPFIPNLQKLNFKIKNLFLNLLKRRRLY